MAKKVVPVKKTAPKKVGPTKAVAKKVGPTKAVAKKVVPVKKAAPKKVGPTKASPTKPSPTKAVAKKAPAAPRALTKKAPPSPASSGVKKAAPVKAASVKAAPVKAAVVKAVPVRKAPAGQTCPLSGIFVPKQSPNITPKTMVRLREILDEERARHVRQAEDLQADADALVNEREQGDTQFDEESGEGDTISVERERDLMMSATARQSVEEIDRAIERIGAGTYGLCSPAGRRIPVARLEAIPWAETCVDCKQRVERRR